jgi:hypothetical protein
MGSRTVVQSVAGPCVAADLRALVAVAFLVTGLVDPAFPYEEERTRWSVKTCLGLEAVVFIGALAGNEFQLEHYQRDAELLKARLSPEALTALDHLRKFAEISGTLIGPNLALLFSAGPAATLDDVIESARRPDARLRPNLEKSQYWDVREWEWFRDETLPDVLTALLGLKDAGFEEYWQDVAAPKLDLRVVATEKYLQRFDIVPELERLLGRPMEPQIEVFLLFFSRPYGIRITGQRLASHYSYPMYMQLRTAAHEMFHPPFERADHTIYERLQRLANDPWMLSIINDHDPAIGYNTFSELLDESATQALDQLLADRMGLWLGPGTRWRNTDGGMHMLAAAIYRMLLEDEYDKSGGNFGSWLDSAIDRGLFTPEEVKRRAALIVGQDAVDRWPRDTSSGR